MQALREASLFPLVSSPPCSFPWGPSGALDLSSLSAALPSPPLSVRTLHHALQFAGTLHNTHLVHPLRLWPAVSHAELLHLSSLLWPPAATIAPIRVPGRRYMARKMHYTVRCHPIPTTCYPAFPVSSPSPSRCSRFSTYPTASVHLTFSLRWPPLPCFPFRCAHGASNLRGTCSPRCSAGPPRPLPLCSCLILPPAPSACTRTVHSTVQSSPFPTLLPSPSPHPPLGSPRCPGPLFPLR